VSLSILIPVYNRDVTLLVSSLAKLIAKEKIVSEIILLDDASEQGIDILNSKLAEAGFIYYFRNQTNLGRENTRKLLAQKANYPHLLFLDCDVKIANPDFIAKYAEQVKMNTSVCTGGLLYDEERPEQCKYKLHWKYGRERETKVNSGDEIFLSSNFLMQKDLFLNLSLDVNLTQYGHEDTLIGIELEKRKISILSIYAPVVHEGLEENSVFIKKSLQAVENLIVLEKIAGTDLLKEHIRLYRWYKKCSSLYLTALIEKLEALFHKLIMKNLRSCNPGLKYFDWMRLAHFIRLKRLQDGEKINQ
jgi:glycosyltransferase involved in cell wall biosynthesis